MMITGTVSGAAWNILDYFADNRLNCLSIFKGFGEFNSETRQIIEKDLFSYTSIHTVISIVMFIMVFIMEVIIVNVIVKNPNIITSWLDGNILQNAYILLFLTILTLYTKTVFALYNRKHERTNQIYKPIIEFGINEENEKEKSESYLIEIKKFVNESDSGA